MPTPELHPSEVYDMGEHAYIARTTARECAVVEKKFARPEPEIEATRQRRRQRRSDREAQR
jgi:hypothetical protein